MQVDDALNDSVPGEGVNRVVWDAEEVMVEGVDAGESWQGEEEADGLYGPIDGKQEEGNSGERVEANTSEAKWEGVRACTRVRVCQ